MSAVAVLDLEPKALSVQQLGDVANTAHAQVERHLEGMVPYAIQAGEALIAAQEQLPYGEWGRWLAENFQASRFTAKTYMRFARNKDTLGALGITRQNDALAVVREIAASSSPTAEQRRAQKEEAKRLYRAGGTSYRELGERYGVDGRTVQRWINPKYAQALQRQAAKRSKEARRALRDRERERAARKVGGDASRAYSLIRKALQAAEDTRADCPPISRQPLAQTISSLHGAEDAICRAIREWDTAHLNQGRQ